MVSPSEDPEGYCLRATSPSGVFCRAGLGVGCRSGRDQEWDLWASSDRCEQQSNVEAISIDVCAAHVTGECELCSTLFERPPNARTAIVAGGGLAHLLAGDEGAPAVSLDDPAAGNSVVQNVLPFVFGKPGCSVLVEAGADVSWTALAPETRRSVSSSSSP